MKFVVVAFDSSGRRFEDIIDAPTEFVARDTINERGLFIVEIKPAGGSASRSKTRGGKRQSRWKCLAEFTRQMAILVSTGTPVVQALGAVERQVADARFAAVVGEIRTRVEEGSTLADAVGRHPRHFDAIARSLIAAGEASGNLDKMLTRLAAVNRQQEVVRRSVTAALSYPSLLFCIAVLVLNGMLMFVVPRFSVLFESLDTPLPPTTAVLMDVSAFLRSSWWWFFPSILASIGGGVAWLRSKPGRRAIDAWLLRAPGFSSLFIALAMARIARVLGVLVESRVPLLDALALTKAAMTNSQYRALLEKAENAVTRGGSVSTVVAGSRLVSPSFAEAVRSGEESGRVGQVLTSLADYLDEDNAVLVKSITQLLEPIVLIVLGLVVGVVAVSMFLPLFDATAATGPAGGTP
jgi:type II secretory pathway component PulF